MTHWQARLERLGKMILGLECCLFWNSLRQWVSGAEWLSQSKSCKYCDHAIKDDVKWNWKIEDPVLTEDFKASDFQERDFILVLQNFICSHTREVPVMIVSRGNKCESTRSPAESHQECHHDDHWKIQWPRSRRRRSRKSGEKKEKKEPEMMIMMTMMVMDVISPNGFLWIKIGYETCARRASMASPSQNDWSHLLLSALYVQNKNKMQQRPSLPFFSLREVAQSSFPTWKWYHS